MINFDGSVDFSDWRTLPNTLGIYAIFDNETCLYVGVSKHIRHRIYEHTHKGVVSNNDVSPTHVKYVLYPYSDNFGLKALEYLVSMEYKPVLNTANIAYPFSKIEGRKSRTYATPGWVALQPEQHARFLDFVSRKNISVPTDPSFMASPDLAHYGWVKVTAFEPTPAGDAREGEG